ncbi:hypothetical protein O181_096382, partial [Austropuccinia psidii MF-1]|nr:hypothetical protein [Austropuccinia psidii MF-1]
MTNDGNQRTKNSETLNSSFRISNIPLPVANVGFLLLQIYIGLSWIVVIYRLVSLGCQLEFLSLPPAFPRYPSFSSTTPTKDYWFTLGSEIIFAIGLLEVIFSIYGLYLIHQIQSRPPPDRQPSIETLKEVMLRALGSGLGPIPTLNESQTDVLAIPPSYHPLKPLPFNDPAAQDFREIHTNWFGKCHWQEIYRDNHLEWICGVLFCKTLEEIKQEDKLKSKENSILNFVEEILKIYENRIGYKIKEGYNLKLKKKIIRPTIDSIKISLKPLTITYSFAYFTDKFLKKFMIFKSNFKFYKNKNLKNPLNYFIKIPKDWYEIPIDQRPKPLFFIH